MFIVALEILRGRRDGMRPRRIVECVHGVGLCPFLRRLAQKIIVRCRGNSARHKKEEANEPQRNLKSARRREVGGTHVRLLGLPRIPQNARANYTGSQHYAIKSLSPRKLLGSRRNRKWWLVPNVLY